MPPEVVPTVEVVSRAAALVFGFMISRHVSLSYEQRHAVRLNAEFGLLPAANEDVAFVLINTMRSTRSWAALGNPINIPRVSQADVKRLVDFCRLHKISYAQPTWLLLSLP